MAMVAPVQPDAHRWPHFASAVNAVRGLQIRGPSKKPKLADRRAVQRSIGVSDLPLVPAGDSVNATVAFCDVIQDVQGPLDVDAIWGLCAKGEWSGLPPPLAPKAPLNLPYTMQIVLVVDDPSQVDPQMPNAYAGKYHAVKQFTLHGGTMPANRLHLHCFGQAMRFDYGGHCRVGRAAVQHMLDQLHGLQITCFEVTPKCERRAVADPDQASRQSGYMHIREKGPRANNQNQFMEWADAESHDERSPLYGWAEAKIVMALGNYAKGRQNAKVLTYWPFTLKNLAAWLLNDVLSRMLGSLRQHSIVWVGKTRVGKSAVSKTVAMAQADYEIAMDEDDTGSEPGLVTAKHMDFFKAQPVTKKLPAIFDDGLLHKQEPDVLKAFLNPSEEDATTWARWGSSSFDMGSCRQACSNPYCEETEARAVLQSKDGTITHAEFVKLVLPSLAAVKEKADLDAIFARAHFIIVTEKHVFWRVATPLKVPIHFMAWPNPNRADLMSEETRPAWLAYKKNPSSGVLTDEYRAGMVWSREYIDKLINGERVPRVMTVSGDQLFSTAPSTIQLVPRLMPAGELHQKIKVEKQKAWGRRMVKMAGTCIDLSDDADAAIPGQASSSSAPPGVSAASSSRVAVKREREESFHESAKRVAGEQVVLRDDENFDEEDVFGHGGGLDDDLGDGDTA
jgi:hypothetical protein